MITVPSSSLEFAESISWFVYALSEMMVDSLIEALNGVIMVFVSGIGVEAIGNVFVSLMTALELAVPKPLGEVSC